MQRKPLSLWMLGLLCIMGGLVAGVVMNMIGPPIDLSTAEGKGRAFGQAAAQVIFIVVGVVMIVVHFVRGRSKK